MTAPTPPSPRAAPEPNPRRIGLIIVAVAFGLFTMSLWYQVVLKFLGRSSEPPVLSTLQFLSGCASYAAMHATIRHRPWAWVASLVFGVLCAILIIAVGPVIGLDADERRGLIPGALSVLMVGGGLALYLRNALRPRAR
jgi:peptidoglycan/LPS O-acetylase OafA/YrhL